MNTAASYVIDGPGDFPDPLDDFDYQTALMATSRRLQGSFGVNSETFLSAVRMDDTHRFTFITK